VTAGSEPTLAEQRQSMREQLHVQRQRIAEQLAPGADVQGRFPRSVTMRLLMSRPELLLRLLLLMARARLTASLIAILIIARVLRSRAAARHAPEDL
jgi:hypothetical protein